MTAPPLYLFTGETNVQRKRRARYGRTEYHDFPAVTVTVLAADQADAERIAGAMLSTPDDSPEDGYSNYIDKYTRSFIWTSAEQAPASTAEAETLRQELAQTVANLDEAQSAGRLALQQAEAEREHSDSLAAGIARVRALHRPEEYGGGGPESDDGVMCTHCEVDDGSHHAEYPCETIRALEGDA